MKDNTSSAVQTENRRLAAIMFTDIVGFSRQMGRNEARTLRLLDTHNQITQHAVAAHHGTVIKTVGDAFLVDFPSVVHAVQGAQQIQAQFRTHNAEQEPAEQIHVRIGIHLGDIVQKEGDVFGDGVNIAKRLQELAEPDSICLSQVVYQEVEKKLALGTVVSLGQPTLKNIDQRFPIYLLGLEHADGIHQPLQARGPHLIRRVGAVFWAAATLLFIAGAVIAVRYLFPSFSNTQHPAPSTQAAPAALPLPDKPSIVVLPFVNMSEDPKQEYFSDGITEDLTSDLSQISSLLVIARNSAFTYKGKSVKVEDIGRELGVRYVLEGSVRQAENQVRITAQLIDATTGHHLWAERYDRPRQEIFALQDEIRQKIVTTLKLQLTLWEQGILVRKSTDNLEAYDYFLRGVEYVWRTTKEANAQAYAALGWTYFLDWFMQWSPDLQNLEKAFTLAQKAIALDDSLFLAHRLLGEVYLRKKQHDQARAEVERALALNPNDADGYIDLGVILFYTGPPHEGLRMVEKAMRLNPHSTFYLNTLGWGYYWTEQYEEAIAAFKRVLTHYPNLLIAHAGLAATYGALGREAEARTEAAEVLRLSPNFSLEVVRQVIPSKDPAVAERFLDDLRKAGLK
ncbi:MAG TPA: adenylate/guanylate cyclase domain-containing protein [Candidatus Binatia bacterium]|jgi:TolB-like protein/class 3 adenylate cyclase/Tfp pilus assembly protein PilF|nr:adenylate/guanylate cyclase domain-containing protein [Candidatus Binatia bacterium]